MSYIKVEGHTSLVSDVRSNAVVNSNKSEFQMYMKRHKERKLKGMICYNCMYNKSEKVYPLMPEYAQHFN